MPMKGYLMTKSIEPKSIDLLLAEADELIRQINTDAVKDMQEEHRLQFEKHAQRLQKIKSKVLGKNGNTETSKSDSGSEGVHEAILDIVKAMHNFKKDLFNT
jgi:vacuolar-type H+-ATPase subunit H